MAGQIDRAMCVFGGLSAVRVGLDRSGISRPAFRICQIFHIVCNIQNELIGDQSLLHEVKGKDVKLALLQTTAL